MLDTSELFDAVGGKPQDETIIERFRLDESLDVPIQLTDLDIWSNYINEDLYAMDKKVREFFKKIRYKQEKKGGYRTTAPAVFTWIYGRKATPGDGPVFHMLHMLLKYYCTSYTGKTTYHGKRVDRVYEFSRYATKNKRPYSLKLRLEEANDGNKAVWRNGPGSSADKRRHGRREYSETSGNAYV